MPEKELEWNLGAVDQSRMGKVLIEVRRSQLEASRNTTADSIRQYLDNLNGLYLELIGDIDDDVENQIQDSITQIRDTLSQSLKAGIFSQEKQSILQSVYELDKQITKARKDVGLGLPKDERLDPETAGVDGLMN